MVDLSKLPFGPENSERMSPLFPPSAKSSTLFTILIKLDAYSDSPGELRRTIETYFPPNLKGEVDSVSRNDPRGYWGIEVNLVGDMSALSRFVEYLEGEFGFGNVGMIFGPRGIIKYLFELGF